MFNNEPGVPLQGITLTNDKVMVPGWSLLRRLLLALTHFLLLLNIHLSWLPTPLNEPKWPVRLFDQETHSRPSG